MRIMKEHMFFIYTAFTKADLSMSDEAKDLMNQASMMLERFVNIAPGYVSVEVKNANEIVTNHTLEAEQKTSNLTGVPINTNITHSEYNLLTNSSNYYEITVEEMNQLNNEAHGLVTNIIKFKTTLLTRVLNCQLFTQNYPLLIDHILREARLYLDLIKNLGSPNSSVSYNEFISTEKFWNEIMSEHSAFIRGLLDPSEGELINTANNFANNFENLNKMLDNNSNTTIQQQILLETSNIKKFKEAAASGLIDCQIKSVILPLLGDHVLREANHYFRLLNQPNSKY